MELVLYGSFNCPYSYLASLRVDRLVGFGGASVEWRAVVHDPDVPVTGTPVSGELADMFDRELEEIRGLLVPGEAFPASCPSVQPNTTAAVSGFAVIQRDKTERLRQSLFSAFWAQGADIGDRAVLDRVGCPNAEPGARMRAWEEEWKSMDRPMVPMMVLPEGKVSRGLGALARLAEMLDSTTVIHDVS